MNYTKGEWKVEETRAGYEIVKGVCKIAVLPKVWKEAKHDARLISATPNLLEACREVFNKDEIFNNVPKWFLDKCERAINKAEGRNYE